LETVLERVVTQSEKEAENDRLFAQTYAYTRIKTTEEYGPSGKLKKRREKTSQNTPVPTPPPVDEQPDVENAAAPSAPETSKSKTDRAFEKKDFILNRELLDRFDFTLVGRETINDRVCLALDFKPKSKDLPVRNLKDRFINKAAGRVWVDEREAFVARADIRLTERVSVIGGLVGAVSKFHYVFERNRTPEGLWFTRNVVWDLEGRQVFIPKVIHFEEKKLDLRRVDAQPISLSQRASAPAY
jgi:hypothetical protein